MKKLILASLLFLIWQKPFWGSCQTFTLGDTCPNVTFQLLQQQKVIQQRLYADSGKWIILDFWNTYCKGCIEKLGRYDTLQRLVKDHVLILPVTEQDPELIQKFWVKNKVTQKISLPTIVADSSLSRYFPHKTVPHQVWINPQGVIMAIAESEYLTTGNLDKAIAGKMPDFPIKRDLLLTDIREPLLVANPHYQPVGRPIAYSTLLAYQPGSESSYQLNIDTLDGNLRVWCVNNSIPELYRYLIASKPWVYYHNRVRLEGVDSAMMYPEKRTETYRHDWMLQHSYGYEMFAPLGTRKETIYQQMWNDLNRWLPVGARTVKQTMPCLVLRTVKKVPDGNLSQFKGTVYDLSALMTSLNSQSHLPVINETGRDEHQWDFEDPSVFPASLNELSVTNASLGKAGLILVPAKRIVELLVFFKY